MVTRKKTDVVQLSKIRMTEELRRRLARDAEKKGATLNGEIVERLERSVQSEKVREDRLADLRNFLSDEWGTDIFNLALSSAKALASIERFTGQRWVEDEHTFNLFALTLVQLAKNYRDLVLRNYSKKDRPPGNWLAEAKTDEQLAAVFADLSGISPPHPRPQASADYAAADRADSLAKFKHKIAKSRPLRGDEI